MMEYFCTLTPLEEYFLGGERTFEFGDVKEFSKKNYYIDSQEEISQTTVLGVMRFVILKKNSKLDAEQEERIACIGEQGFMNPNSENANSYGMLKSLSPILLYRKEKETNQFTPLIQVPYNHKNGEKKYQPFSMMRESVWSDIGEETWLPGGENYPYVAKEGITDAYMLPNGEELVSKDEVFRKQTRTRIAKNRQEDGFYKKRCCLLQNGYCFGFVAKLDDDWCPEVKKQHKIRDEIVYLGQEKSAFLLSFRKVTEENPILPANLKLPSIGTTEKYVTYYVLSDSYCQDVTSKMKECLCYSIIQKRNYRFMTQNVKNMNKTFGPRMISKRFQFIKVGSVFYVKKEKEKEFIRFFENECLKQIGFNVIKKMGE